MGYGEALDDNPDEHDHKPNHKPPKDQHSEQLRQPASQIARIEVVNTEHAKEQGKDDVDAPASRGLDDLWGRGRRVR